MPISDIADQQTYSTDHEGSLYRVEPRYRALVYFSAIPVLTLFGIMAIIELIVAAGSKAPITIVMLALITLPLLMIFAAIWKMRRWATETWLAVSQQGLTYHTLGLTIQTSWENIERVKEDFYKAQCILHQRSTIYMGPSTTFSRWTSSANWNIDRRIPLSMFSWSRQSQLRRELEHYIPHLIAPPR